MQLGFQELEEYLRDFDGGSARDINFLRPTWRGFSNLLARFNAEFQPSRDREPPPSAPASLSVDQWQKHTRDGGGHWLYESGQSVLRRVQVFLSVEPGGQPFVELTFFPEDLTEGENVGQKFAQWVRELTELIEARACYVRYESAGWKLGDNGPRSSVFYAVGEAEQQRGN